MRRVPEAEKIKRREEIARYYLHGKSQAEIAELIGLHQSQVSGELKAIQQIWVQSTLQDFDTLRSKELAKVDDLELTYRKAWDKSATDPQPAGDPRFLAGVQWCINKRCELLGLNAPTKVVQTDVSGRKEFAFASLDDEARIEKLSALLVRRTEAGTGQDTVH